jgi:hypothetical protein
VAQVCWVPDRRTSSPGMPQIQIGQIRKTRTRANSEPGSCFLCSNSSLPSSDIALSIRNQDGDMLSTGPRLNLALAADALPPSVSGFCPGFRVLRRDAGQEVGTWFDHRSSLMMVLTLGKRFHKRRFTASSGVNVTVRPLRVSIAGIKSVADF